VLRFLLSSLNYVLSLVSFFLWLVLLDSNRESPRRIDRLANKLDSIVGTWLDKIRIRLLLQDIRRMSSGTRST